MNAMEQTTSMSTCDVIDKANNLKDCIEQMDLAEKVRVLNEIRMMLHEISPFSSEPVDCVQWVIMDDIESNDYNPNKVAPPEMKLLEHSITEDGYTQPIVAWHRDGKYEVVDGFHRNRVARESLYVKARVSGYLPLTIINADRDGRSDRIASTIRHNRARGKHTIDAMSDIVIELKRRNWTDSRISRELGMDQDEILRLCQITGLADLFSDQEFSKSWDVEGSLSVEDFEELSDDITTYGEETEGFRTVNTNDPDRIFHTWDKWECYKAGFYKSSKSGMSRDECEQAYCDFLGDQDAFSSALESVITEWVHSCEHYLTNVAMNRIAWLGQASMCYATGVPAAFRGGFSRLDEKTQNEANNTALVYLNKWLVANGRAEVTMEEAIPGRQATIY